MAAMNWRLAGGWILAVIVTTALAWQIVAVADEQVGDDPVSPIEAAPPSTSEQTTTTVTDPTVPTTSQSPTTTTESSASTSDGAATSATSSGTAATPSTSASTSTSAASTWSTKKTVTQGGTVVVGYRPGEVRLETAVPLPGFQVEIEKSGPPEVDVEFDSESRRVRIKAKWEDDGLQIDVEDSSEEHDD